MLAKYNIYNTIVLYVTPQPSLQWTEQTKLNVPVSMGISPFITTIKLKLILLNVYNVRIYALYAIKIVLTVMYVH